MWLTKTIQDVILSTIKPLFDDMRKEFGGKFEGLDTRFNKMEERLDKRFDDVDKRLGGIDQRLDDVDKRLGGIDQRLDDVERKVSSNSADIVMLEEKVMGALDGVTALIRHGEHVKNHEARIVTLEQDSVAVKAAIKNFKEV